MRGGRRRGVAASGARARGGMSLRVPTTGARSACGGALPRRMVCPAGQIRRAAAERPPRGAPGSLLLLLSGELELGFSGGEAAMARRTTPARAPSLSGGEAAMAGAEHATARRTAASSVSSAAAAQPPSPFPRRSRRLALSGGGSGALAPRRLDNDDELPLLPSSLFRPPHNTWVPPGSPRPVSTGGRPFPPRPATRAGGLHRSGGLAMAGQSGDDTGSSLLRRGSS